jgi:hypothetical protein
VSSALTFLLLLAFGTLSAAPAPVQVQINVQFGDFTPVEDIFSGFTIDQNLQSDSTRLLSAPPSRWSHEFVPGDPNDPIDQVRGLMESAYQLERDPLINLRFEVENLTDTPQNFAFQIKIETDPISGPTFNDSFASLELIDADEDGFASLFDGSTFIEVIDDPGEQEINGNANLGSAFFYGLGAPGTTTLFDIVGSGPDADDFDGVGFNFMRFRTEGLLGAGDKLVITAMGCYGTTASACPDRYEITAVPAPASVWLLATAVGALATRIKPKARA